MLHFFLKYLELILTMAGLLVIVIVPSLFSDQTNLITVQAITATVVGILHGIIFFIIRHRQRLVRQEAIEEIRNMLKDVVNNQLTVIGILAANNLASSKALDRVHHAVQNIHLALNSLSEESLQKWKSQYVQE